MKNSPVSSSNRSYPFDSSSSKSRHNQCGALSMMQIQKNRSLFYQFFKKFTIIFSALGYNSKTDAPEVDQGYGIRNSNQIHSNSCKLFSISLLIFCFWKLKCWLYMSWGWYFWIELTTECCLIPNINIVNFVSRYVIHYDFCNSLRNSQWFCNSLHNSLWICNSLVVPQFAMNLQLVT